MNDNILKIQRKFLNGFTGMAFTHAYGLSPSSTLVINLTSARNCPCRRYDKCKDGNICAPRLFEMTNPSLYHKHIAVERFLKDYRSSDVIRLIQAYLDTSLIPITHIRLDGAGDFKNQNRVIQWDKIAQYFWETRKIITYTYSKRRDLDFRTLEYLVVNKDMENVSGCDFKCMPNMF